LGGTPNGPGKAEHPPPPRRTLDYVNVETGPKL
jgi:hypothetical protein